MFVAVPHQEPACKETDSALNSGLESKRTNTISLTKQETRKDTDERRGGGEREKEIEGESTKAIESAHGSERTWKKGQSTERERHRLEVSEKHGVGVSRKIKQFAGPKRKVEKSF